MDSILLVNGGAACLWHHGWELCFRLSPYKCKDDRIKIKGSRSRPKRLLAILLVASLGPFINRQYAHCID